MSVQIALEQAIHLVAPTAKIDIKVVNGHWCGTVVAPEFDTMPHSERQRKISERISQDLGSNAIEVGTLRLYSPVEADALNADD